MIMTSNTHRLCFLFFFNHAQLEAQSVPENASYITRLRHNQHSESFILDGCFHVVYPKTGFWFQAYLAQTTIPDSKAQYPHAQMHVSGLATG